MSRIALVILCLVKLNVCFCQKLEMQLNSINPILKRDTNGDSIRKYFSVTLYNYNNFRNSKKVPLAMVAFYSNNLLVNPAFVKEKIPDIVKYKNDSSNSIGFFDAYSGKYAIPIFDSSGIIFTVNGINQYNAHDYEYRVIENNRKVVLPWTTPKLFWKVYWMTKIANPKEIDTVTAYLGQFKAAYGNALVLQIRRKDSPNRLEVSMSALWVRRAPRVVGVFSFAQFYDFLQLFKKQWMPDKYMRDMQDWTHDTTLLHTRHQFNSNENSIIFYLDDVVNSKDAIEYNLVHGKDSTGWRINDFDLNFVWLKNLAPGNYQLKIRYSIQRENVCVYNFTIATAWYQTIWFKMMWVLLSVLAIGFGILLVRSNNLKRKIKIQGLKNQLVQTELKSIRSQFNPHFVFNALSSIQGLITKNDSENATKYLIEFGDLMRDSLKASNTEFSSISKEIKMLENYLNLERLRFGFTYQIITDENIDIRAYEVPNLLLQPLVENAIKHGISSLKEKGTLIVSFVKLEDNMVVSVIDNGKGFSDNMEIKGFGLQLTKERIKLLNHTLYDQQISLTIRRKNDHTHVILSFKNWLI
ncbi:sensor histidine kinase [Rhizosphaericola mali]|nr:histidine kinase [Rhizosphaericola mali]